jgi:hypothetical protein
MAIIKNSPPPSPVFLPRVVSECKPQPPSSTRLAYSREEIDMSSQTLKERKYSDVSISSTPSDCSFGSCVSSINSCHASTSSSFSGAETPVEELNQKFEDISISESATPVNDTFSLDPNQLTLRLHLHAAIDGQDNLPEWDGLADALRVYFATSWYKDAYTLQECEKKKSFLFWNAVANEKWERHSSERE